MHVTGPRSSYAVFSTSNGRSSVVHGAHRQPRPTRLAVDTSSELRAQALGLHPAKVSTLMCSMRASSMRASSTPAVWPELQSELSTYCEAVMNTCRHRSHPLLTIWRSDCGERMAWQESQWQDPMIGAIDIVFTRDERLHGDHVLKNFVGHGCIVIRRPQDRHCRFGAMTRKTASHYDVQHFVP